MSRLFRCQCTKTDGNQCKNTSNKEGFTICTYHKNTGCISYQPTPYVMSSDVNLDIKDNDKAKEKCTSIVKKTGERCKNNALADNTVCRVHNTLSIVSELAGSKSEEKTCPYIKKQTNTICGANCVKGTGACIGHIQTIKSKPSPKRIKSPVLASDSEQSSSSRSASTSPVARKASPKTSPSIQKYTERPVPVYQQSQCQWVSYNGAKCQNRATRNGGKHCENHAEEGMYNCQYFNN